MLLLALRALAGRRMFMSFSAHRWRASALRYLGLSSSFLLTLLLACTPDAPSGGEKYLCLGGGRRALEAWRDFVARGCHGAAPAAAQALRLISPACCTRKRELGAEWRY